MFSGGCLVQVGCFLLACPSPLPLGTAVFSTPVSCMQLSALLFSLLDATVHACSELHSQQPAHGWGNGHEGMTLWLMCAYYSPGIRHPRSHHAQASEDAITAAVY